MTETVRYLAFPGIAAFACIIVCAGLALLLVLSRLRNRSLARAVSQKTAELARLGGFLAQAAESEEKFRSLVENMSEVIFSIDPQGTFTYISPLIEHYSQYRVDEVVGKNFTLFIHPDDLPGLASSFTKTLEGSLEPFTFRIVTRDGEIRYVQTSSRRIMVDGTLTGITGLMIDITERKRIEAELELARHFLSATIEHSPVGIIVIDAVHLAVRIINSAALDMFGVTDRGFVVGIPIAERFKGSGMCHADGTPYLFEEIPVVRTVRSGETVSNETMMIRRNDASERWILINSVPIYGAAGELETGITVFSDITDLRSAQKALFEEKERLAVTLRSIGDGVIATDLNANIVLMNRVAEYLTGYSQAEAMGQPIGDIMNIGRMEDAPDAGGGDAGEEGVRLYARDGTSRMIEETTRAIHGTDGSMIGAVVAFRDMTEKLKNERELLKAQKLESIGILAGGIAHDFNNILTAIMGNISIARLTSPPESEMAAILNDAERATARAKDLTQQLLTFARGSAPEKRVFGIERLAREATGFVLRGSNIRCAYECVPGLLNVNADRSQVGQVIQNLVINAKQAMPQGGNITVRMDNATVPHGAIPGLNPGIYVRVAVCDEGPGVAEENRVKVFDPYFTTKEQGNGLGLSVSYSIMKKHDGIILLDSKPGEGATFTIYLPAAAAKASEETAREPLHRGAGRILVMDDDETIHKTAQRMLTYLGYEAVGARNGEEAIELYRRYRDEGRRFAAVIMDLTIPAGMGGKEAVRHLLDIDPGAIVIVSSGYSTDPVMAEHEKYGFRGIIRKPFVIEDFSNVLHRLLGS